METFHGTTILSVRRDGAVALGGDGQVTLGSIVVKSTARKVRRLYHDKVLAGFAGATADAFTLSGHGLADGDELQVGKFKLVFIAGEES